MKKQAYAENLSQGIEQAKSGQRILARMQLEQAIRIDPTCLHTWIWLAWTADSPAQAARYLTAALSRNPNDMLANSFQQVVTALRDYDSETIDSRPEILGEQPAAGLQTPQPVPLAEPTTAPPVELEAPAQAAPAAADIPAPTLPEVPTALPEVPAVSPELPAAPESVSPVAPEAPAVPEPPAAPAAPAIPVAESAPIALEASREIQKAAALAVAQAAAWKPPVTPTPQPEQVAPPVEPEVAPPTIEALRAKFSAAPEPVGPATPQPADVPAAPASFDRPAPPQPVEPRAAEPTPTPQVTPASPVQPPSAVEPEAVASPIGTGGSCGRTRTSR